MKMKGTTPVPNALFDLYLKESNLAELKVLLIVIRQTLGWADNNAPSGRKERDWITGGQLQQKTGNSRRAISSAIDSLTKKKLIDVTDSSGNNLHSSAMRKGKTHLYFRINSESFQPVENELKRIELKEISNSTYVKNADLLSKNITLLGQKLRITKETIQN